MNIRRPPFFVVSHLRPRFAFLARSIRLFALCLLPALALAENPKQSSELAAKKTDDGILFQCSAPGAEAVYLAGNFNNWAGNTEGVISDAQYKMDGPDANGVWHKTVTLAAPPKSGLILYQT
ncbi:MAG: hypothetical protein H0W66_04675 [Chthoniobacterales bacterium]|nr:hypothetical protein [Chthoniobacterales bacterium]